MNTFRTIINTTLKDISKTSNTLLSENILDEGDKKKFDKESGYNVSEDEDYYYNLIKKKRVFSNSILYKLNHIQV